MNKGKDQFTNMDELAEKYGYKKPAVVIGDKVEQNEKTETDEVENHFENLNL